ncbi:MAG: hypothetical protein Q7R79_00060 [bacterium]|nr:hypothetical protein [bacterium]
MLSLVLSLSSCCPQNAQAETEAASVDYVIEQVIPDQLFVVRITDQKKDGRWKWKISASSTLGMGLHELSNTYEIKSFVPILDHTGGGSQFTEGLLVSVSERKK